MLKSTDRTMGAPGARGQPQGVCTVHFGSAI